MWAYPHPVRLQLWISLERAQLCEQVGILIDSLQDLFRKLDTDLNFLFANSIELLGFDMCCIVS